MELYQARQILEEAGLQLKDFGETWRAAALWRGGSNQTSICINKRLLTWYDFVEQKGGTFQQLCDLLNHKITINDESLVYSPEKPVLKQPKTFSELSLCKLEKDHTYWLKRNIDLDVLNLFDGGIVKNGKMANRYVFPIWDTQKKKILGFTGRWLGEVKDYTLKYKHLGNKNDWLFPTFLNLKDIIEKKEVILVEGPGCVLSLFNCGIRNVLCVFGTKVSSKVIQFLLKYNIEKIIIAFNHEPDNDSIGDKASKKELDHLINYFDNNSIEIRLPFKKDFNEMNEEEIDKWYNR